MPGNMFTFPPGLRAPRNPLISLVYSISIYLLFNIYICIIYIYSVIPPVQHLQRCLFLHALKLFWSADQSVLQKLLCRGGFLKMPKHGTTFWCFVKSCMFSLLRLVSVCYLKHSNANSYHNIDCPNILRCPRCFFAFRSVSLFSNFPCNPAKGQAACAIHLCSQGPENPGLLQFCTYFLSSLPGLFDSVCLDSLSL